MQNVGPVETARPTATGLPQGGRSSRKVGVIVPKDPPELTLDARGYAQTQRLADTRAELTEDEFAMVMAGLKFRTGMRWDRVVTDEELAVITTPILVLFGVDTVVNDPDLEAAPARQHILSADVQIYPSIGHDLLWASQEVVSPPLPGLRRQPRSSPQLIPGLPRSLLSVRVREGRRGATPS